jgi:hypothetical protein
MSTETIDIVVRESGAQQAAQNIQQMGTAAALSDKEVSALLQRAGTSVGAMSPLISTTGTAIRSLADLGIGATRTGSSLQAAGVEAGGAATKIGAVAEAAGASGVALNTMRSATAGVAGAIASVGTEAQVTGAKLAVMAGEAGVADRALLASGVAARTAKTELAAVGATASTVGTEFGLLQASLAGLGLAFGIKQLVSLGDTYQSMSTKLQLLGGDQKEFEARQKAVFDVAQASRQPLEAVNSLYAGLAKGARNYEVSAKDVVNITSTLAKSATTAGKDMNDQAGAMKALGLAMLKGELDGRPFMALIREMPGLLTKVAPLISEKFAGPNGMGKFIEAAQNGGVSMRKFLDALKAVGGDVDERFKNVAVTVSGAFTQLSNAVLTFVGSTDQGTGATRRLAEGIQALIPYVPQIIQGTLVLTAAFAAYTIGAVAARVATVAFTTSFAGIVAIVAGVIAAIVLFGDTFRLNSEGTITLLGALVGGFRAVRDICKEVYTELTSTAEGIATLGLGVTILTGLLWRLIGVAVVGFIRAAIAAFIAFAVPIATVTVAVVLLIAALAGLRFAWVAVTKGMDAAKADLIAMKDKVVDVASSIKEKFTKEMKDATTEFSGGLGALKPQIQSVGDEFNKAGISVVKGGSLASGAVKQLTDDTINGVNVIRGGLGIMSGKIKEIGPEMMAASNEAKSALTGMDQSLNTSKQLVDQFAHESVTDFQTVSSAAQAMAQSVSSSAAGAAAALRSINGAASAPAAISRKVGLPDFGTGGNSSPLGYSSGPSIDTSNLGGAYSPFSASSPSSSGSFGGSNSSTPTDMAFATGGGFTVGGQGGTDSQMVKFLATPGERVTVETPSQAKSRQGGGGNGAPIHVHMTVNATDANSFRLNETQITTRFANKLKRVQAQLGG